MSHWEDAKRSLSTRCYYFKLLFFFPEAQQLPESQLAHHIQPQNTANWVFLLLTSFLQHTLAGFISWVFGDYFFFSRRPGNQINKNTLLSVLDSSWPFLSSRPVSRCDNAALPPSSSVLQIQGNTRQREMGRKRSRAEWWLWRGFIWKRSQFSSLGRTNTVAPSHHKTLAGPSSLRRIPGTGFGSWRTFGLKGEGDLCYKRCKAQPGSGTAPAWWTHRVH